MVREGRIVTLMRKHHMTPRNIVNVTTSPPPTVDEECGRPATAQRFRPQLHPGHAGRRRDVTVASREALAARLGVKRARRVELEHLPNLGWMSGRCRRVRMLRREGRGASPDWGWSRRNGRLPLLQGARPSPQFPRTAHRGRAREGMNGAAYEWRMASTAVECAVSSAFHQHHHQ